MDSITQVASFQKMEQTAISSQEEKRLSSFGILIKYLEVIAEIEPHKN